MNTANSPSTAVTATRRVAAWLTHFGVSNYAFDDTIGLINPLLAVHRLRARVVAKIVETPAACTVVLQAGPAFNGFEPGQFVMIAIEINGVRHRRAYSPRSVDGHRNRFAITTQRQTDGKVSNFIQDRLQVGSIIEVEQAAGEFVLPSPSAASSATGLLMIAGGSGITPCMSILEHLHRTGSTSPVTLIYFARNASERIFGAALQKLAASWPALRYVPIESTANTETAVGAEPAQQNTLTAQMLADAAPNWQAQQAYCCGPAPLMDAAKALWEQLGLSSQLKLEAFAPIRPSGDPSVKHKVAFKRADETVSFNAAGNQTVLVSGEEAGFALKHGCRQGICHECTCRLQSGAILDLTTGNQIRGEGQVVRICVSSALSDLELESLS